MNIKKQGLITILTLAFFLSHASLASTPVADPIAKEIIDFSLFTYDNLIADHYEENKPYLTHLVFLLHKGTQIPSRDIHALLNTHVFSTNPDPVSYMLTLNKEIKALSGYYFIDG